MIGLGYNLVTNPQETVTAIVEGITNKDASKTLLQHIFMGQLTN